MKTFLSVDILLHPHDHKRKFDWNTIFKFLDKHIDYSEISNFLDRGAGLGDLGFHFLKNNQKCEVICEDNNFEYHGAGPRYFY